MPAHPIPLDGHSGYCFSKDLAGRYTHLSPSGCAFLGLPLAAVLGKTDDELPGRAKAAAHPDPTVLASEPLWLEEQMTDPQTGQRKYLWSFLAPIYDPVEGLSGVSGIVIDITRRKLQEQALLAAKNQLAATLDAVPDLIFEMDHTGTYLACHTARPELLAAPDTSMLGRHLGEVLPAAAAATGLAVIEEALRSGHSAGRQIFLDVPEGARWFELTASRKVNEEGQPDTAIVVSRDITAHKQALEALEARESLLRAVVDNTPLQYWARDLAGNCIMENHLVVDHWGSLIGSQPDKPDIPQQVIDIWQDNNRRAFRGETVSAEVTYPCRGEERIFHNVVAPVRMGGEIVGIVGFNQDITERKRAEEQIRNLAFFDPLTQLPNRRLMFDRLNHALVGSGRRARQGALLLIDLDNFKILNDTRGHDLGDHLLIEAANRLATSVRQGDTAARLGGDEFVVILEDIDNIKPGAVQAEVIAEQIQQRLAEPYRLPQVASRQDYLHRCSCSIGITLFTGTEFSAEELLRRCDTALYQAKAAGRNSIRFYDPEMQARIAERASLEADLREAIEHGHLLLHYQVQVDTAGTPIGAEALLRWRHPARGMIYPGTFITLAEETGLIVPIGDWVLEAACRQLAAWQKQPATARLTLAVNVSARQFCTENFAQKLITLVETNDIQPGRLKLELTESLLIEHTQGLSNTMAMLKEMGIGFSLDDFGTGYSSLAYLKKLPLDQLKIDQSFVRDILSDANDAVIARTILVLGESLGIQVIAEGVETAGQQSFLARHGCRKFQGYLYGRAEPIEVFEKRFAPGT